MHYKKIDMQLIVAAEEAETVVTELNAALNRMEERHEIFGGGIETVAVEHRGMRRKSALKQTLAAGETAADALRIARAKVAGALRQVI